MDFTLNKSDQAKISEMINETIKKAIKQVEYNPRPYLNRKDIAKYFGVAESTIRYWASLGMPVSIVGGRKLYGKQSITDWLKSKERPNTRQNKQEKKPITMQLVTGNK